MKQLTIRGFDEALERRLRELAQSEGISLNQAALRLMRKGAGTPKTAHQPKRIADALDDFFGTWTKEEAQQMLESAAFFEQVDPELWR